MEWSGTMNEAKDGDIAAIFDWSLGEFAACRNGAARPPVWKSVDEWWEAFRVQRGDWKLPIDQAFFGGARADRIGYAFAAGYQAALLRLDPTLPQDTMVSLSITEEGGGHPKAIQSTLTPAADGSWTLNGRKKWATLASGNGLALVAASTGADTAGRNQIRVVRIGLDAAGVTVESVEPPAFVPEIHHCCLKFDNVRIPSAAMLAGDGYAEFIKPFRTLEDVYVTAAVMMYLLGIGIRFVWPRELCGQILALLAGLRALAQAEPKSPGVHLALEGLLANRLEILQRAAPLWDLVDLPERTRWQRDRPLTSVAERVRTLRTDAAWKRIGVPDVVPDTVVE